MASRYEDTSSALCRYAARTHTQSHVKFKCIGSAANTSTMCAERLSTQQHKPNKHQHRIGAKVPPRIDLGRKFSMRRAAAAGLCVTSRLMSQPVSVCMRRNRFVCVCVCVCVANRCLRVCVCVHGCACAWLSQNTSRVHGCVFECVCDSKRGGTRQDRTSLPVKTCSQHAVCAGGLRFGHT